MRELTERLLEELYDSMLDQCSESCSTCDRYGASRILREIDPIAYRCGMADYQYRLDTFDCEECRETFLLEGDSCNDCNGRELCDDCKTEEEEEAAS